MRILILEQNIQLGERLFAALRDEDWSLDWTNSKDSAKQSLIRDDISLMVLDMSSESTPSARAESLRKLCEIRRDTPVVLIVEDENDSEQLHTCADLVSEQPVDMERVKSDIRMLLAQRVSKANGRAIQNEGRQPLEGLT